MPPRDPEDRAFDPAGRRTRAAGLATDWSGDAGRGRARRVDSAAHILRRAEAMLDRAHEPGLALARRLRFLVLSGRCLDAAFEAGGALDASRAPAGSASAARVHALVARQEALLRDALLPALASAGRALVRWEDLADAERHALAKAFEERVFPVLTPLRVGPAHPAPQLASLALHVGLLADDEESGERFFARVDLPPFLPRLIGVPGASGRFAALEEVVAAEAERLLPGAMIESRGPFRVTRSRRGSEVSWSAGASGPLPPRGPATRIECGGSLAGGARRLLLDALGLDEPHLYLRSAPLDWGALEALIPGTD